MEVFVALIQTPQSMLWCVLHVGQGGKLLLVFVGGLAGSALGHSDGCQHARQLQESGTNPLAYDPARLQHHQASP